MRKILITLLTISLYSLCFAQKKANSISETIALKSRNIADRVLSEFDTLSGSKILYSLQNRYFYIIVKAKEGIKEYVVSMDSENKIIAKKEIENDDKVNDLSTRKHLSKKEKNVLKRFEDDAKLLNEAFDQKQYHTGLLTNVENATYIAGVPSYFVYKDENNNRYGEYSLSSIVTPCPINPQLWLYLFENLSKNIP